MRDERLKNEFPVRYQIPVCIPFYGKKSEEIAFSMSRGFKAYYHVHQLNLLPMQLPPTRGRNVFRLL